jgi:phthalate 4,5-dioxygenase oxygenase subunit
MLSVAENELLTKTGSRTIMGDLIRQYWIPALLPSEVPAPDCPPVRVRLLGENLIAFRTTAGKVGLIQDACPHRAASLFFGRNEEDGIRCVYHGWKFDVTGQCLDMLSEPEDSDFASKVKARAYPCVEKAGIVWTYMGPGKSTPPFPDIEVLLLAEKDTSIKPRVTMMDVNWFQAIENNVDTAHQGILHYGSIPLDTAMDIEKAASAVGNRNWAQDLKWIVANRAPEFFIRDLEAGVTYAAKRPGDPGTSYWRTQHMLFPFYTMSPVPRIGTQLSVTITVPVDDEHCMSWSISANLSGYTPAGANPSLPGGVAGNVPNSPDWLGRFRWGPFQETAKTGFDFGIDREKQSSDKTIQGYSCLPSVPVQDRAIVWSQGTIVDRSTEHLATTDSAIIRVRRRLLDAAKALRNRDTPPPGVNEPEAYRIRSGWAHLPEGVDYWEGLRELREEWALEESEPLAPLPSVS